MPLSKSSKVFEWTRCARKAGFANPFGKWICSFDSQKRIVFGTVLSGVGAMKQIGNFLRNSTTYEIRFIIL